MASPALSVLTHLPRWQRKQLAKAIAGRFNSTDCPFPPLRLSFPPSTTLPMVRTGVLPSTPPNVSRAVLGDGLSFHPCHGQHLSRAWLWALCLVDFLLVLLHLHRSWWLLLARQSSAFRILCFPLAFVLSSFLKCPVFALPCCSLSRWSKVSRILFWGAGDLSLRVWKDMKELDWWMVERSLGVLF